MKKRRSSGGETLQFLREKQEANKKLAEEEMKLKTKTMDADARKHNDMMAMFQHQQQAQVQQLQMMQQQLQQQQLQQQQFQQQQMAVMMDFLEKTSK